MALFDFNALPGLSSAVENAERVFLWGKHEQVLFRSAVLLSTATDKGNTPTTTLRAGLVLAQLSTGKWSPYDADASDGSELAMGVLATEVKMLDLSGTAADHLGVVVVGGPVKGGQLLYNAPVASASTLSGADQQIRAQFQGRFVFDDDLVGNPYPWKHTVSKAADYTVVAGDNGTVFEAITGAVTFTLPALLDSASNPVCKGMRFKFFNSVDANMVISRAGSDTMICKNNAAAVTVTFSTSSAKIGACADVYTNAAGTKWIVEVNGDTTATVA